MKKSSEKIEDKVPYVTKETKKKGGEKRELATRQIAGRRGERRSTNGRDSRITNVTRDALGGGTKKKRGFKKKSQKKNPAEKQKTNGTELG